MQLMCVKREGEKENTAAPPAIGSRLKKKEADRGRGKKEQSEGTTQQLRETSAFILEGDANIP